MARVLRKKTRKNARRGRKTRKGGARGETLRFRYTTNPKRVMWTEAMYPFAAQLISLPAYIPWESYSFDGETAILYPSFDVLVGDTELTVEEIAELAILEKEVEAERKEGEVNTKLVENDVSKVNVNYSSRGYHPKRVLASCIPKPYEFFGGSACEIYNARYKKEGGPNLHDNVDPTGDIDIRLFPLQVTLVDEEDAKEAADYRSVVMTDDNEENISILYLHFTDWLIGHIETILRPLAAQMETHPMAKKNTNKTRDTLEFYPKTTEANSELIEADKEVQIGNILITRAITRSMIKIQCGIGVRERDNPDMKIADHFCEFVLAIDNMMVLNAEKKYTPASRDSVAIVNVPREGSPAILVESPITLLNQQAKGFIDRIELRNNPEYIHKLYNHYERVVFALKLCDFLQQKGVIPSNVSVKSIPHLIFILFDKLLGYTPSPCPGTCSVKKILRLLYPIMNKRDFTGLVNIMKQKYGVQ